MEDAGSIGVFQGRCEVWDSITVPCFERCGISTVLLRYCDCDFANVQIRCEIAIRHCETELLDSQKLMCSKQSSVPDPLQRFWRASLEICPSRYLFPYNSDKPFGELYRAVPYVPRL